jgi:hypothetical protein
MRAYTGTDEHEPVMNESTERARHLELTLFGPAAASVVRTLGERYHVVTSTSPAGTDTVMTIADIDQAGERAVLTFLWDTGHQVRSVLRTEP